MLGLFKNKKTGLVNIADYEKHLANISSITQSNIFEDQKTLLIREELLGVQKLLQEDIRVLEEFGERLNKL